MNRADERSLPIAARRPARRAPLCALLVLLSTTGACASAVAPATFDGATSSPDASGTLPLGCYPAGAPTLPIATYAGVTANCSVAGVDCPPGRNIHVDSVEIRFPCSCSASSDPVIQVQFSVTDDDTAVTNITLDANLMGCVHPGYHAQGAAFALRCGSTPGPLGQWAVLLRDTAGNHALVGFSGVAACSTTLLRCHPNATPTPYEFDCAP